MTKRTESVLTITSQCFILLIACSTPVHHHEFSLTRLSAAMSSCTVWHYWAL